MQINSTVHRTQHQTRTQTPTQDNPDSYLSDAVEIGLDSTASVFAGAGAGIPLLGLGVHRANYETSIARHDEEGRFLSSLGGACGVIGMPLALLSPELSGVAFLGSAAIGGATTFRNIRRSRRESGPASAAERFVSGAAKATAGATFGAIPGLGALSGLGIGMTHMSSRDRDLVGGITGLGAALAGATATIATLMGADEVAAVATGASVLSGAVSWSRVDF